MSWEKCRYHGVDVVESVVENNNRLFGNSNISFSQNKNLDDLPDADLCVSKDVFQHLPISVIKESLAVLKKKCKLLLITNDIYPDQWLNVDIPPGAGRAVKLYEEPFNERATALRNHAFISYGVFLEKQTVLILGDR